MFVENMNKVLTECPEDWVRCVKNHPDLTVEITTEIAKRQSSVAEAPDSQQLDEKCENNANTSLEFKKAELLDIKHLKCTVQM